MYIPPIWIKKSANGRTPEGREIPVSVWGWGDDEGGAAREATSRLQKLLDRIRRGESFPDKYSYGRRPLKEQILEVYGRSKDEPAAIRTRNGYGAEILNTARMLFLDIDLQPVSLSRRILAFLRLGPDTSEQAVLAGLRDVLKRHGRASFRIYRTAAGFRVLAVDREFDPEGREARELMEATGTDPAFIRLCGVQKSFRARLTPKPFRCDCAPVPGAYPRQGEAQQLFLAWLSEYEQACAGYATCRYLETVGSGRSRGNAGKLIEAHDQATRCTQSLPLA